MAFKFNPFTSNFDLIETGGVAPYTVVSVGSGATATVANSTYLVDTSGGTANLTLPTPAANVFVRIKDKGSARTNNITVTRSGSESIDGVAASFTIDSDLSEFNFVSDGTNWFIV